MGEKERDGVVVRVALTPYPFGCLLLLLSPGLILHEPLARVPERGFVAVKLPQRVFRELKNEGDEGEDLFDDVVVGVVGEGPNLREKWDN